MGVEAVQNTIFPWDATNRYDLVLVGTGFGSSFFLQKALQVNRRRDFRVLCLEWGGVASHAWRLEHKKYAPIDASETYVTSSPGKPWWFTMGFGGGTNCWGANAPRFHPTDFALKTRYGVSRDWPFSYDDLEPYYLEAEQIMEMAGDDDVAAVLPRSGPYPQRMHRLSTPDEAMKRANPQWHFGSASARMIAAKGDRGACCAIGNCSFCHVNSKFTVENGMPDLYADPRVSLIPGARVLRVETQGDIASAVIFAFDGVEHRVAGDMIVLGANAIHAPFILLKSGFDHPLIGRGLHEKAGFAAEVLLDGMNGFDGGVFNPGVNYALYDGEHRRTSGAVLISTQSAVWSHGLRLERGRWRQSLPLSVSVENLAEDVNGVTAEGDLPNVTHGDFSAYAKAGIARARRALAEVFAALPVEDVVYRYTHRTQGHMQGTLRMGTDPADSVVDGDQIHHRFRNLAVVGSSVFPSCSASNPSLTVAATALRAADRLYRSGRP